ncbi:short chain dehydrogenase/ reductase [Aspergillus egyptiacus]|nr:short chain dehydrogenase/ reductase [Aspergillus egyptiacus]
MAQDSYMKGVALITGAASGIGRATAHTFVREGCTRLVLGDIDTSGLQTVSQELQDLKPELQILTMSVDVTSEEHVEAFVAAAVKHFGGIHYAVNNAGITSNPRVRTHELPTESWDDVLAVNLRGVWLCQRAELKVMMGQGRELEMVGSRTGAPSQRGAIVNISSLFGIMSHPTVGGYSAAKSGVLGMTRTDALAYAEDGIRVNSVLPGLIKTPMVEESIRRGSNYEQLIGTVPARRWGRPEEVAEAVVFLAGERASFITGESLVVDGGKQCAA